MGCKGYSLIEVVVVILVISLIGSSISIGKRMVDMTVFHHLVKEVEQDLIFARDAATATGRQYNVYCFSDSVLLRQGVKKPIHTTMLSRGIYIPNNITGKWIKFNGTMASGTPGTITLVSKSLGIQADITVRIATGKITIYYRAL